MTGGWRAGSRDWTGRSPVNARSLSIPFIRLRHVGSVIQLYSHSGTTQPLNLAFLKGGQPMSDGFWCGLDDGSTIQNPALAPRGRETLACQNSWLFSLYGSRCTPTCRGLALLGTSEAPRQSWNRKIVQEGESLRSLSEPIVLLPSPLFSSLFLSRP